MDDQWYTEIDCIRTLSNINLTRLCTLKNSCNSIDIGMNLRKRLLTPKVLTIKIDVSNSNLTWTVLCQSLNSINPYSAPDDMTVNGANCSDKQAIAEHFNLFVDSVGELNSKNITEHGDSSYRDYLSERIEYNFEFRLVDFYYIKQIIKEIKTSRSNWHDGISSELLKLISNDIADSITLIINQSLKYGIFPTQLKIAKVTLIYIKKMTRKSSLAIDLFLFFQ